MKLSLAFSIKGTISGDGIDDIAPFTIGGFFDHARNEANWTKSYILRHSVEYHGLYDGRTICGNWTLGSGSGGFWIWPSTLEAADAESADVEEAIDALVM
jgi:hypothetical protein